MYKGCSDQMPWRAFLNAAKPLQRARPKTFVQHVGSPSSSPRHISSNKTNMFQNRPSSTHTGITPLVKPPPKVESAGGLIGKRKNDIIHLRQLLRCPDDPETAGPSKPGHVSSWLPETKMRDVRFIGFAVSKLKDLRGPPKEFHIGISVLDTKSIEAMVTGAPDAKSPEEVIDSYHFIVPVETKNKKKPKKDFLFGREMLASKNQLRLKLMELAKEREVVSVYHDGYMERMVTGRLKEAIRPICEIDTAYASQFPHQLTTSPFNLETLLTIYRIPFRGLHYPGNDAHFAVRAMLMTAVVDAELQQEDSDLPNWLSTFKAIARAPPPPERTSPVRHEELEVLMGENSKMHTEPFSPTPAQVP
ncbi:hypothetical protein FZEAL_4662 [Fusarium zealandicum]|uniref:Gfd2/YDR514C-like C-terminal domain-containing protein n=1 Tax=Fusarium zealandicum TaxID=1053134 RepID=A0A8H4ULZ4_9HYPO|nr:hypothetical protein FZEAL_4662 [Fusarium zealandicum]